ncbi:MAG: DNA translocase FtsK 4TM domain-containing protein, partial [Lachnospiraceae bacterium]|nr:DNA translocase FtsK 4TM domain-containing protein [Lachnospiraceae bacterium]
MSAGSKNRKSNSAKKGQDQNNSSQFRDDVILLIVLAFCILLFLSCINLAGSVGRVIGPFLFGTFGMIAFVVPVALFFAAAFYLSNRGKSVAWVKVGAAITLVVILCSFATLLFSPEIILKEVRTFYAACQAKHASGGFIGCLFSWILMKSIGNVATYILLVVLMIISIVLITERSFFKGVQKGSETIYHSAVNESRKRKERRAEREEMRRTHETQQEEQNRVLRSDKKVSGVMIDTTLKERKPV